jgi:hypothetical protein
MPTLASRRPAARRRPRAARQPAATTGRVEVESVNVPGYRHAVDATRYGAMKSALLRVLPRRAPGLTQAELFAAVIPHLPEALFPGGAKAGWWAKTVQLDLEAKGAVGRDVTARPLRWTRTR